MIATEEVGSRRFSGSPSRGISRGFVCLYGSYGLNGSDGFNRQASNL